MFGLGATQTLVVLIALTAVLVAASIGARVVAVVAGPAGLLIAGTVLRFDGVPLLSELVRRVRWGWGSVRGYRSCHLGITAEHAHAWRLPGPLAPTSLLTVPDPAGDYGLVWHRRIGTMTVTLRAASTSTWLVDRDQATAWVANWGGWLAGLGWATCRWCAG